MKKIAIFGSTGSIGTSTLNVIRQNPRMFEVTTLVAGQNIEELIKQIEEFKPKQVYIKSKENAELIKAKYKEIAIYYGREGMEEISQINDYDISVSALVGIAGLKPTYHMIKTGKPVAFANKEVLVTGGKFIIDSVKQYDSSLLPVDSEHCAIFQCLQGEQNNPIDKILLTASGGPFFDKEITKEITVEQALNHPTWKMGKKITIDSATMMNKGFEVIEAKWLFNVSPEQIQVVVHKQSIVHSMVQYQDGTIMASMGPNNMQIPISYCLNYPNRVPTGIPKVDLFALKSLTFEEPNLNKFKCLKLAFETLEKGHSYQVALNAANEVLVDAFLNRRIAFTDIGDIAEKVLQKENLISLQDVESILQYDVEIRKKTNEFIL